MSRTKKDSGVRNRTNAIRSAVEPLEGRLLMSTVVVNTAIDALYPASSGLISIRNAVATANSATTPTTITFDPTVFATPQTIVEDGTQLSLTNTKAPISIIGSPAGVTLDANRKSRAIGISGSVIVEIADLTITDAQTSGYDFYGAGINNSGTLTLVGSTMTDNNAADGGAISSSGTAILIDDTFTGNTGYSPFGGGADNSAVSNSGTMTVDDCTIVGNTSVGSAAGLGNGGTCVVANSIIAANNEASVKDGDATGTFTSYGYNLVGATDGSTGWNAADKTGTAASLLSPDLGALTNNGGATATFLPETGSPVIGAGSTAFVPAGYVFDQRGLSRTVGGAVDIGSIEVGGTAVSTTGDFVVNSASDTATGAGTVTLRDAVELADADVNAVAKTITFDPTVFASAQTITLNGTAMTINSASEPISITGPASGVTISGNNTSQALVIQSGAVVTVSDLTITDCSVATANPITSSPSGGAILIAGIGTLNLFNSTLTGNYAAAYGGALDGNDGTMNLVNDTITNNTSITDAGGVSSGGAVTIEGCTITANSTNGSGGGIYGPMTEFSISNSIIAGNSAITSGADVAAGSSSTVKSLGYNLVGDVGRTTGWTATDLTGTTDSPLDADLGSLASNGGPTQTVLPQSGSPALSAGSVSLIPAGITTDQRGDARTLSGAVEIGAVEVGGAAGVGTGGGTGSGTGGGITSTATAVDASSTSIATGESVTFTAAVASVSGSPTGTVTFYDNGTPIDQNVALDNSDTAVFTTTTLPVGQDSITVAYSGDATFAASTSPATVVDVVEFTSNGGTNTTLTASADTVVVSNTVTFNVNVAPANGTGPVPTGSITFFEDGNNKGAFSLTDGALSEAFTAETPGPDTTFTAVYSGDANYTASTSNTVTQTYLPQSQLGATISRAVIPTTGIAGQKVSVRVPVTFKNTGGTLTGSYTVMLYADTTTGGFSGNQVLLETVSKRATLKTNKSFSTTLSVKTLSTAVSAGVYYLLAEVLDPAGNYNLLNTDQTITVATPVVNLQASIAAVKPATILVNKSGSVILSVTNTGNVNGTGSLTITLSPSADGVSPVSGVALASTTYRVTLKPGKAGRYTLHFKLPVGLAAGSYLPYATISLDGVSTTAIGATPFTAG